MKVFIKVNGESVQYSAKNMDYETAQQMVREHVRNSDYGPAPVIGACLVLVADNTKQKVAA